MLPGGIAVQDMDTDHGRLYVAMAEKCLDRAVIVAPSSGCVADKWSLIGLMAGRRLYLSRMRQRQAKDHERARCAALGHSRAAVLRIQV